MNRFIKLILHSRDLNYKLFAHIIKVFHKEVHFLELIFNFNFIFLYNFIFFHF